MVGFYVFGGGMGHLSRVKKFIEYQNIIDFKIFTGTSVAYRFFKTDEIILFIQKGANLKSDLIAFHKKKLSPLKFEDFYVDCFPAGILYELTEGLIQSKRIHYLTRRIKENSYQFNQTEIEYKNCFACEKLEKEQLLFVQNKGMKIEEVNFAYDPPVPNLVDNQFINSSSDPIWLIVHSSNIDEIELLILKANQLAEYESQNPQLILISDNNCRSDGVYWINNEMNPRNYFSIADKIFTGAGYNIIEELNGYRNKHVCLPFERRYDDQKWRIDNAKND